MAIHTAPRSLVRQLEQASVPFELLSHRRTTSAIAEAHALGLSARDVAKTVVLTTPDGFVRAVVPASERLDFRKARAILGSSDVELASEEMLAGAYPEFELGAVPPLCDGHGDRVLIDGRLADEEWIVLEAGTHEQSVRLRTSDLVALCDAEVADLSQE